MRDVYHREGLSRGSRALSRYDPLGTPDVEISFAKANTKPLAKTLVLDFETLNPRKVTINYLEPKT